MLLRLISRPAYYYYGLGDEVQLSAETLPVRVRWRRDGPRRRARRWTRSAAPLSL